MGCNGYDKRAVRGVEGGIVYVASGSTEVDAVVENENDCM